MTEEDAQTLIKTHVPRETFDQLTIFAALLADAATQHNLISAATLPTIWSRHILDSAQLAWIAAPVAPLLDIGSGAGLPGLVLALLLPGPVTLSEPRALRVEFLRDAIETLGLGARVDVQPVKVQRIEAPLPYTTITARAVAPLADIFAWAADCADRETRWILPRGRSAREDVAVAERLWHGRYEIVPSLTDSEAAIVIAQDIRRKGSKPGKQR